MIKPYLLLLTTTLTAIMMGKIKASTMLQKGISATRSSLWRATSLAHREEMLNILYPVGDRISNSKAALKERQHLVHEHPIFNFLHTYYRYSSESIMKWSPGVASVDCLESTIIEGVTQADVDEGLLHDKYICLDQESGTAKYSVEALSKDKKKLDLFTRNRDILRSSSTRQPVFSCYGLHEWAMLYKNNEKKQSLQLRLPQEKIDEVVESVPLRCTHYDAFRFFEKSAQRFNKIQLTRATQVAREQPACIHATMDLFKYAYSIYPLCSADLLRDSLKVALKARYIDMRASPYDVSTFAGCEEPIHVETEEGKALYAREQEALMELSAPLRSRLTAVYDSVLIQAALQGP